jgi:uncharacterized protein (TIGR02646 family)
VRKITKRAECGELRAWKKLNATSLQNIHYDNLGKEQRNPMLEALIFEQGGLCAYTMKQIVRVGEEWQAHIEHILPRSLHPAQSVDWANLLACLPGRSVGCEYGAKRKDNYDSGLMPFLNPTKGDVSVQFRFRENGEVEGLTAAAKACVDEKVLNLNHIELVNDRASKIRGALEQKPTAKQARHRAQELRKFSVHGELEPYCEALAQVLEAYAVRLEKRAVRLAGAKRQ